MSTCLLTYCDNRLDKTADVCYHRRAVSNSPVAQLVEQLTVNKQAPTNSPSPSHNDLHARKLSLFLSENNGQLAPSWAIIDNKPLLSYRPLKTRRTQGNGGLGVRPLPLPAPSLKITRRVITDHVGGLQSRLAAQNMRRVTQFGRVPTGSIPISTVAGSNPAPSLKIKSYRLWNLDIPRRPLRVGVTPSSQSTLTIPPLPRNTRGSVGVRSQGGLYTEDSRWFLKTWHCALLLQCGQGGERLIVPSPSCLKNLTREAV